MKKYQLDAQEIKNRIQPEEFYSAEQKTLRSKRRGWVEAGICPFHDDRSAGSFFIHLSTGAFRCWSCDAQGGDIINYVMQKYSLSFKEALVWLKRGG